MGVGVGVRGGWVGERIASIMSLQLLTVYEDVGYSNFKFPHTTISTRSGMVLLHHVHAYSDFCSIS